MKILVEKIKIDAISAKISEIKAFIQKDMKNKETDKENANKHSN